MTEKTCPDQLRAAIPVRIRGMSSQNRFFDEQTETDWVGEESVASHLRNLVDLETEVHLINLKNHVGGTFRVIWANTRELNGFHSVGLELLDRDGDLWEMTFPVAESGEAAVFPQVWLGCQRCHLKLLSAVPEAQGEFLCEGFQVARHCDQCRATTPWSFMAETQDVPSPGAETEGPTTAASPRPERKPLEDHRAKGRAPLRMAIKVTRKKYGTPLEDICQTINISRKGAYFLSNQVYEVGEVLDVVLNYKEGALALPVPARVVRLDQPKKTFEKGIAIQLLE